MTDVPHPRSRRWWRSALLVAALAVPTVLGASASAVPGSAPAPVDGSASGGDDYFPLDGNGGYQVRHYDIAATMHTKDGRLRGRTTMAATAGADALGSLSVDLVLAPDWVKVEGQKAQFTKPNRHELRVTPAVAIGAGSDFTLTVGYHGKPAGIEATGVQPFLRVPGETVAIGEPQIGPWWFAANETPQDKASYDVRIRVPRGQQGIGVGRLVSKVRGKHWTTWHWRQDEPILTYLAFFAAGRFALRSSTVDGRRVVYAVSRKLRTAQRDRSFRLLQRTPGVTRWLEAWLGDYPYADLGGVIHAQNAGFALENAGRPTYPYLGGPTRYNTSLVVHEMAHQWFGDDVSLRQWRDIWLNEGLASYAEWRYAERMWGDAIQPRLLEFWGAPWGAGFWSVVLSDPGPRDLFAQPVYDRGAMTVAALRCRIGESTLDQVLRTWLSEHAGGHGTGPQFRALAEDLSGEQLDGFFGAWLDSPTRPPKTAANGLVDCA